MSLHGVNVGSIVDVSEMYAVYIFIVGVMFFTLLNSTLNMGGTR
jgi:hypothetical protein